METDGPPRPPILVLEDEPLISDLLEDWLSDLGCETVGPAHSVQGALGLIAAAPLRGAILDVSLRGEESYSVAQALIERGVPFAFATGHDRGGVLGRFPNALILVKPFSFEDVRAAIGRFCGESGK
jgi:DNA-binding response OmpR family regulator